MNMIASPFAGAPFGTMNVGGLPFFNSISSLHVDRINLPHASQAPITDEHFEHHYKNNFFTFMYRPPDALMGDNDESGYPFMIPALINRLALQDSGPLSSRTALSSLANDIRASSKVGEKNALNDPATFAKFFTPIGFFQGLTSPDRAGGLVRTQTEVTTWGRSRQVANIWGDVRIGETIGFLIRRAEFDRNLASPSVSSGGKEGESYTKKIVSDGTGKPAIVIEPTVIPSTFLQKNGEIKRIEEIEKDKIEDWKSFDHLILEVGKVLDITQRPTFSMRPDPYALFHFDNNNQGFGNIDVLLSCKYRF